MQLTTIGCGEEAGIAALQAVAQQDRTSAVQVERGFGNSGISAKPENSRGQISILATEDFSNSGADPLKKNSGLQISISVFEDSAFGKFENTNLDSPCREFSDTRRGGGGEKEGEKKKKKILQPLQICIGPTLLIGRGSWCLPCGGFFLFKKKTKNGFCANQPSVHSRELAGKGLWLWLLADVTGDMRHGIGDMCHVTGDIYKKKMCVIC